MVEADFQGSPLLESQVMIGQESGESSCSGAGSRANARSFSTSGGSAGSCT
jgi:hypothetical protein